METLLDLAKTTAAFAILMGIWYALQALMRRAAGHPSHHDVLGYMTHGCCGGCENAGKCGNADKHSKERDLLV